MTFLLYFHDIRLVFLAMSCTFVARLCISHPTLVDRWHRCVDAAKKIIRQHKIIIMIIIMIVMIIMIHHNNRHDHHHHHHHKPG